MIIAGLVTLIFAGILHSWYAVNAGMARGHAAVGFMALGRGIIVIAVVLLSISVTLIWMATSLLWATAALIAYFLVFPLAFLPLLRLYYRPTSPGTISHAKWEEKNAEWEAIVGVNDPPRKAPVAKDFWLQLFMLLNTADDAGEKSLEVQAGELHRRVGWYPGPNHRMPVCCRVMREEMQLGDVVLEEPPKGAGASLRVRYQLPRLTKGE